jgi:antitoxin (DNA-binding transcriptional repressor) of toxin-antitoxin stability system
MLAEPAVLKVNMHEAKTQLSKLVEAVERGDEVVIRGAGEPVAELRLVAPKSAKREFGRYKGLFTVDDRFFEPMSDEEIGWPRGAHGGPSPNLRFAND